MALPPTPLADPGSARDASIARTDLVLAKGTLGVSGLLLALWLGARASDPHGGFFLLLAGAWLAPAGTLLLVAHRAARKGWSRRWLWQGLPWAWLAGTAVACSLAF